MTDFGGVIPFPNETAPAAGGLGRRNVQTFQQFSRAENPDQIIDAVGGERLAGSGFENENPEAAFGEAEE